MEFSEFMDRVRERLDKNIDWPLLQRLKVSKTLIGMTAFDFFTSIAFITPATFANFLYVNEAGRFGFIHMKWMNYTDIFKFRRFQPWEAKDKTPIDWENHDYAYINETRHILDKTCSNYESDQSIPGDPGDYLREVAGHPNESGYNTKVHSMIRTFSAALCIIFICVPILCMALWWKKYVNRIVQLYICINIVPMFLMIAVCEMARDPVMCAINIIYSGHPVQAYFILFTVVLWLYTLAKFGYLGLYCMEQRLKRKRKDFGFKKQHSEGKSQTKVGKAKKKEEDVDMEALLKKQARNVTSQGLADLDEDRKVTISGKKLAREILELGSTTEEDIARMEEEDKREGQKKKKKSVDDGKKRGSPAGNP